MDFLLSPFRGCFQFHFFIQFFTPDEPDLDFDMLSVMQAKFILLLFAPVLDIFFIFICFWLFLVYI
jgi:hypothetical protein